MSTARWEGRPIAERLYAETRSRLEQARGAASAPAPRLASVAVGEGTPFSVYQKQQGRMAARAGLAFDAIVLPASVRQRELEGRLDELDRDPAVTGVILQHPLPSPLDFHMAIAHLTANKDVDGVGPESLGRLASHQPLHVPAVALAARAFLTHYGAEPQGKETVLVGRSETVGVPTALLLLLKGAEGDATLTVVHSRTRDLDAHLRRAELLISCAGQPGLLHRGNVQRGAKIVDVGLSTRPDPDKPGGVVMAGDADARSLDGWAGALTPVPGGVGPVTVAFLMSNCADAYQRQRAPARTSAS